MLNVIAGRTRFTIGDAPEINRWLPIVFDYKKTTPDRLFSSRDRDSPGTSPIGKLSSTNRHGTRNDFRGRAFFPPNVRSRFNFTVFHFKHFVTYK